MGVEVREDAEFLATNLFGRAAREADFEPLGVDARPAKFEWLVGDAHVLGDVEIVGYLGAAQHGANAGDQLGEAERLGDVIVAPILSA